MQLSKLAWLSVLLTALKILGLIKWSWLIVLAPLLIEMSIVLMLLLLIGLLVVLSVNFDGEVHITKNDE